MLHNLEYTEPHESWGGWQRFLDKACEVRDQHDGVTFYGATNCNYIVFPCGTIVENFGYHGRALMSIVREAGHEAVLDKIKEDHRAIKRILDF